jgi:tRNA/rRNA methyltransferase
VSAPRVHVVLVRPENASNVGAVARAMRNTGMAELRLVQPGDWRTLECWRSAWGAHEVLEQARVFEALAPALAGASLVVALSGRRDLDPRPVDVRLAAEEIGALGAGAEACLVFGPESSGLTLAEIAQCGLRALIPAHPDQPSLNLSHAVMVACHEVFRVRLAARASSRLPREAAPRVTHEQKDALLALLREGLLAIHALPRQDADSYFRDWQALVQRLDLTPRELRLLEHLARKMAWRPRGG